MSFDNEETAKVLYYLGHPAKVVDENSLEFNSLVNDRLKNFPADFEDFVRKLLVDIEGDPNFQYAKFLPNV